MVYVLRMVIFYSYVKLPEGIYIYIQRIIMNNPWYPTSGATWCTTAVASTPALRISGPSGNPWTMPCCWWVMVPRMDETWSWGWWGASEVWENVWKTMGKPTRPLGEFRKCWENSRKTGWWFGTSYFSEGWLNHQPEEDWRRISAPYLSAVVRKLVTFLAADLDLAGFEQFYDIATPNISLK